jgi:CspA family cold shock protein
MPKGYVKFYDSEKGFGYVTPDEGIDIRIPKSISINGAESGGEIELEKGTRVDVEFFDGRNGPVATSLEILNEPKKVVDFKKQRKSPEELVPIIEGLINILDDANDGLRLGKYPDKVKSKSTALILRRLASQFD